MIDVDLSKEKERVDQAMHYILSLGLSNLELYALVRRIQNELDEE